MAAFAVHGPRALKGVLRVPGDKSISHRGLLLAALADGTSTLRGLAAGDDVARTRAAVEAMGAEVEVAADGVRVRGGRSRLHEALHVLDVGNSGTTMRLLAGWCAGCPWLSVLDGDDSLARRPMDRVVEPLRRMGAELDGGGDGRRPPLVVRGGALVGIDHTPEVASAQVKGAILLAALAAEGETVVREGAPTRAHSEELLALAGADIDVSGGVVRLRPSALSALTLDVPGDPSAAAYWVVAACLTPASDVTVESVYVGPARTGFLDVLARMGAEVDVTPGANSTADLRARSSELHGTEVGADEVPALLDEIPVLAVAAACAKGATTFAGVGELRVKESDRLASVSSLLFAMGAAAEVQDDSLVVVGGGPASLRSGVVDAQLDHRVALAGVVAGLAAEGTTTVTGWEAVATSYPGFEEDLARCGS